MKIYESYNNANYIQSLMDYNIMTELKNLGLITDEMKEEEKEKIKQEKIDRCNICLYELEKGKYLNCGHAFHLKCIRSWVSQNAMCPLCKSKIKTDENIHSRFLNERLGLRLNNNNVNNNANNNNPYNIKPLLKESVKCKLSEITDVSTKINIGITISNPIVTEGGLFSKSM
jgi:hypothetical protein